MAAEAEQRVHSWLAGAIVNALIPQKQIQLQRVGFWARVQADSIGPLWITAWGNQHCFVIFHPFTKRMEAIPVKRAITVSCDAIPWHFINEEFPRKPCQEQIMKELCTILRIKKKSHIAGQPPSSGQVEYSCKRSKET